MEKESSVWRPVVLLSPGLRDGRWLSEKARRRWREEGEDVEEEERKECRYGVEELRSSIGALYGYFLAGRKGEVS
jgi:hypothetical protein